MKFIANTADLSIFLGIPIKKPQPIKSISSDTRAIKKDSLFIAIKGKNFDGNDFVEEALAKGAVVVITDHQRYKNNINKKSLAITCEINHLSCSVLSCVCYKLFFRKVPLESSQVFTQNTCGVD